MEKEIKEFVIDRSKWRCGGSVYNITNKAARGKGLVSMLNKEGFMCCLGHVSLQLGHKKERLLGSGTPGTVESSIGVKLKTFLTEKIRGHHNHNSKAVTNSSISIDAIEINDDTTINQIEREKRLRELFKKHGYKLKFVGKTVKP